MPRNYTDGKSDQELIGQIGFGEPVSVDKDRKKKVLITGAGSYIGRSFIDYAREHYKNNFVIEEQNMMDESWKTRSFSGYDIVYHVAGIAHADVGNVSDEVKEKYYRVNTDLAIEVARKAKKDGVKQFIFMSSMIVYGDSAPFGEKKVIDAKTVPKPANFYGDSKLQADVAVRMLADDTFQVLVIRPPMIYGKGSKGNYPILAKMAKKLPVFPKVDNERSMLYIGNLCEFLCQIMLVTSNSRNAIVLIPQNAEWTKTSEMVRMIAEVSGKKIWIAGGLMKLAVIVGSKMPGKIGGLVNKAFGNSCYEFGISNYVGINYVIESLKDSVNETEGNKENKPRALMLASVASMLDLFNKDNIDILLELGYQIDVAANFKEGSITSQERVDKYRQELVEKGIDIYQVPIPRKISKLKEIISSYQIVKKLAEEKDYKIVHCHSPIGGVVCRLAFRKARKRGTKVIYTAHGFHFFDGASKKAWILYYPIEKICSRYTDVLITINQEDYHRAQSFKAQKVEYVPGIGVHTKEIEQIQVDRDSKRMELGLDTDDFVLMSTGQLSVRKNHEVIIKAIAKIHNPKIKYLLIGFGEQEEKLKQLVMKLNIEDRVIFAGYRDDVKEIVHVVDAFAFPSLQEGLPVSLMEAMAAGLPVVCSNIRGNVDLIKNGKGGYVYECKDVDGFANGIKHLYNSNNDQMKKNNISAIQNFDTEKVNKKMRWIYNEITLEI